MYKCLYLVRFFNT